MGDDASATPACDSEGKPVKAAAEARQLEKYRLLLTAFVERRLSGIEFESIFFPLFQNDPTIWSETTYELMQSIFIATEDFTPDAYRIPDGAPGDDELRSTFAGLLSRLQSLVI